MAENGFDAKQNPQQPMQQGPGYSQLQDQAYQPQPTGGAKAGYFALGFFLMLIGVLISWLITKDKGGAVKSAGLKFSLIGFGVGFASWILMAALTTCSLMSLYAYM